VAVAGRGTSTLFLFLGRSGLALAEPVPPSLSHRAQETIALSPTKNSFPAISRLDSLWRLRADGVS